MDSRQSRRRSPWSNARPRVDAWRADAERAGEAGLPENRIVLVPAEAFPLACTARGLQEVYLDVHLHPTADGEIIPDPDGRPAGPSRRTHGMPPG